MMLYGTTPKDRVNKVVTGGNGRPLIHRSVKQQFAMNSKPSQYSDLLRQINELKRQLNLIGKILLKKDLKIVLEWPFIDPQSGLPGQVCVLHLTQ